MSPVKVFKINNDDSVSIDFTEVVDADQRVNVSINFFENSWDVRIRLIIHHNISEELRKFNNYVPRCDVPAYIVDGKLTVDASDLGQLQRFVDRVTGDEVRQAVDVVNRLAAVRHGL